MTEASKDLIRNAKKPFEVINLQIYEGIALFHRICILSLLSGKPCFQIICHIWNHVHATIKHENVFGQLIKVLGEDMIITMSNSS